MRAATVAASTSGSPSTTGSPTAATSPGSGTPTSSCWPVRFAAWPARAPGPPRWRCASSTPACHRRRSRSRRRSTARSIARVAEADGSLFALPTYTALLELRNLLAKRGLAQKVLGVSSAAVWHEVECGGYAADLPVWERLAAPPAAPCWSWAAGRAASPCTWRGRGSEVWAVDADASLLEALRARAAAQGLAVRAVCADVRALDLDREFELILAPMQLLQMLGSAAARRAALERAAGHLASGGRLAAAIVEPAARLAGRPRRCPSRRPRARRLGLLEPSGRRWSPAAATSRSAGCGRRCPPTAR